MTEVKVHSHAAAIEEVYHLLNRHLYSDDSRDITVVLDREDTLDFLKNCDEKLYDKVSIDIIGDYFYVTSSFMTESLFVESVETEEGKLKVHETDILILPHYVPNVIVEKCNDGCDKTIRFVLESVYDELLKIIEN